MHPEGPGEAMQIRKPRWSAEGGHWPTQELWLKLLLFTASPGSSAENQAFSAISPQPLLCMVTKAAWVKDVDQPKWSHLLLALL